MRSELLSYGLMGMLAIGLLVAAFTDIRRRTITNWLNLTIALGAPLFWWASGARLVPDVTWQLGIAVLTFVVTAGLLPCAQWAAATSSCWPAAACSSAGS